MSSYKRGLELIFSDDTCCLNGELYRGVPLLVNASGEPVDVPSAWFRYLATAGKRRTGLQQTARNLVFFLRWARKPTKVVRGKVVAGYAVPWTHVTDHTLLEFRSACKRRGNKDGTVNAKLSVIYRFYWWAQEHGHIKNRIGSGTSEEGTRYPIQITRFQLRGRWYITSDFLLECHEIGFLPIPTDSEIDDAFVRLAQNLDVGTSARNILMFNWVLVTGVRRAELLALCIDQLPADGLPPRADGRWPLEVVGKGGKVRTIYATNDLLESTRSYWDNERQTVIRSTSAIKGAEQIFITHTTGESLSERQANRIFKDAFANAASKLHTHRVRAKFATDFINENVDAQVERVGIHNVQINLLLDALAQVLGHADKRTLRRYVQIRMRWHAQGFGKLERTRGA